MEVSSSDKVFAIIMVSLIPVITLCILFNLLVLIASKQRAIDLVTCTLLLGRLGHACAVVILMGVYTLEAWPWSRSMCQTFVWLWVTFWTLDVLTNLLFLIYSSTRVGHSKRDIRCHMFLVLLTCWGLAILAGALTFITDSMFHNFQENTSTCTLGLSISENPILIGTMLVIILGGLLIVVLTISVSAETRSLALKCKMRQAQSDHLRRSKIQNGGINNEPEMMELSKTNGIVRNQNGRQNGNLNSNNNSNIVEEREDGRVVYHWIYVDKQMRDTRHIHGAASATTLLLNMIPQLVLYAIDIMSGTLYVYTHHILIAVGLLHCVILPITMCTTGLRYKETSKRLVNSLLGRHTQHEANEGDVEQNLVFHIRDVTTTDSSDANSLAQPENDSQRDSARYKRGQLQVMSTRGEPSRASSIENNYTERHGLDTVQEENVHTRESMASSGKRSSVSSSLKGTVNPGYVETEAEINGLDPGRPDYLRSQSDAVVDYREEDSDWDDSWDSDSETWSNLYDYSDIDEVLDNSSAQASLRKLSPNPANPNRRRGSRVSHGSKGHRRKLSSQVSLPADGQSPQIRGERERRQSEDRRRRKKSKRRGRKGSRDLASGLESTMNLGLASTMLVHDSKVNKEDAVHNEPNNTGTENVNYIIPPPPPLPNFHTLPKQSPAVLETNIDSDEDNQHQSEFASQLAAAALVIKNGKVQRQPKIMQSNPTPAQKSAMGVKNMNIAALPDKPSVDNGPTTKKKSRKESLRDQLRKSRKLRRGSSSSQDCSPNSNQRGTENTHHGTAKVHRTDSKMSQNSVKYDNNGHLLRKHSHKDSHPRTSEPPTGFVHDELGVPGDQDRPVSAPQLDPALSNMTLGNIMTNPFLKDLLRQSLESLDSLDSSDETKQQVGRKTNTELKPEVKPAPSVSPNPFVPTVTGERKKSISANKPSDMRYYEIPNIDSDHRHRPRKPIRRGIQGFKAAAQAVSVQNFLKKAMTKPAPAPKPKVDRTDSRVSWNNDQDYFNV